MKFRISLSRNKGIFILYLVNFRTLEYNLKNLKLEA